MCSAQIYVGGQWRAATPRVQCRASGAWREVYLIQNRVAGAWKQSFTKGLIDNVPSSLNSSHILVAASGTARAGVRINSGRNLQRRVNGTWTQFADILPFGGNNGNWAQIRYTSWTGTRPSGKTINTWYNLTSNPVFEISRSSLGITSGSGTFQIRDSDTGNVLDSFTCTLTATRETPL